MYRIAFGLLACAAVAACSPTTTGTVAGATTGAIVGGPVGAVVGGGIGAVAGATTTQPIQARPGYCYVYDQKNRRLMDVYGDPQLRRC
jgi:uncharacterized protein YcfJ